MRRTMQTALLLVAAALPLACGNDSDMSSSGAGGSAGRETIPVTAGSPDAVGGTATALAGADSGGAAPTPEGNEPQALNGCTAQSYADHGAEDDERVVQIAVEGLKFTPPCISIAVGQTVKFEGSLASHPLAPGNASHPDAGSPDSPIQETTSGTSVEFTFDRAGTFPYYCELHGFGDGQGMSGSVYVK